MNEAYVFSVDIGGEVCFVNYKKDELSEFTDLNGATLFYNDEIEQARTELESCFGDEYNFTVRRYAQMKEDNI